MKYFTAQTLAFGNSTDVAEKIADHGKFLTLVSLCHGTSRPIADSKWLEEPDMMQETTPPSLYLVLLLTLAAALFSTPGVREALADRHPRPLLDVMDDIGASMAMQMQPMTD